MLLRLPSVEKFIGTYGSEDSDGGRVLLNKEQVSTFFKEVQQEDLPPSEAEMLIQRYKQNTDDGDVIDHRELINMLTTTGNVQCEFTPLGVHS